jgi:hypothetical protein
MDKKTSTPTLSSQPSSQPPTPEPPESTPTSPGSKDEGNAPGLQLSPTVPVIGATGFEINLGPVTLTDLDFSNSLQVQLLAAVTSTVVAALAYREYMKLRQQHIDKEAFEKAQATFIALIDKIEKSKVPVSVKINFLDHLLNRSKVRKYNQFKADLKTLRGQLHSFEHEYGGRINVELERAIHHLNEISVSDTPDLDMIVVALDGVYNVAKRLNLPMVSIHSISSITFQLRNAKKVHL